MTFQADVCSSFLDALVEAIQRAAAYNKNDQVPPATVLWTDKERQWEPLLPQLRDRLPLLTLGSHAPPERKGSAYWLRCVLARALPEESLPAGATPIIYLPGVSRQEIRAIEECPKELQPLAELQYLGVLWTQKNGRDWTIAAFLQNEAGGLGIDVGVDNATKEAMYRALLKLAAEPVSHLRKEAPLRAPFFDSLLNPDEVRGLLQWLDDPSGYRTARASEEWESFRGVCRRKYGFDPETDGEVTAAGLLGQQEGALELVWHRFAEAPGSYLNLPDLLRRARPQTSLPLFYHAESWPQDNEKAEAALRTQLLGLDGKQPEEARALVADLEQEHGQRRSWVWASLGMSPMATALGHLNRLARETEKALAGTSMAEIAAAYVDWGWKADAATIGTLAGVEHPKDVAAVFAVISALYRPWLEDAATAWQKVVGAAPVSDASGAPTQTGIEPGTCVLFTDGLRFDIARSLAEEVESHGYSCQTDWRLGALPGVTETAKPAVAPLSSTLKGGPGLAPVVGGGSTQVNAEVLRKLLADAGYQVLKGEDQGDPAGRAWTELGDIDSYGHEHGWKVAHHLGGEIRALATRIQGLLEQGWKKVVVVTDHGWLLLPGGLPKMDLPEHLTDVRKGRCARLQEFSDSGEQWMPWYWDNTVRIAMARGIHCYEAGKEWEHGGLSPQECVLPVLQISTPVGTCVDTVAIQGSVWKGLRCSVTLAGAVPGLVVDLRTKASDPATSIATVPKSPDADGAVSLLVQNEDRLGSAALIVVVAPGGTVLAQTPTIVGG